MAECSKCGKKEMTFKCRYCGEKFCSEHRLPENHDCEDLDSAKSRSGSSDKWFEEKDTSTRTERKPEPRQKPSVFDDMLRTLRGSATLTIIGITILSFVLQIFPGYTDLLSLSPALTQQAVNESANVLSGTLWSKPWSLFTVMIVHGGFFHIFANMVTFYFFGSVLEKKIGNRELLKFYLVSGLVSSIGYVLFRNAAYLIHGPVLNSFPTLSPAVGASGAVVAVFAAVAVLYPDAEVLLYFFIPMKIRTALYLFAGFETFNLATNLMGIALPIIGNFASSAHLTGLICGVYFGRKLRQRFKTKPGALQLFG